MADQSLLHEKDDSAVAFNQIHISSLSLRRQMVELAQYSSVRTSSRNWARCLRFLELTSPSRVSGSLPHHLKKSLSSQPNPAHLSLNLTPRLDVADGMAYIAISYCWQRPDIAWFLEQNLPHVPVSQDGHLIPQHVVTDVLYRAARYASHKDLLYIWIDQYCISQEDPSDKLDGIQAMDIVYQNASHPVTLLESYIGDQAELDAFASLMTGTGVESDQVEALERVLEMLSEDAWFTRAWTLQEATSAGSKMLLLIACDPKLEKPDEFGSITGEIEISIWEFHNAMILVRNLIENSLASGVLEDTYLAVSVSNLADILFGYLPEIYPNDINDPNAPHRQTCNAAEAINCLRERKNSHFPDRLAILANMCDYEIRIDTRALEMPQYAFSTCILTLAILNGDMSLLGRYSDPQKRTYASTNGQTHIGYRRDISDLCPRYGFSWGLNPKGCLEDIEFHEVHGEQFVLRPASLSMYGLTVQGILWHIGHKITVTKTQTEFAFWYQKELQSLKYDRASAAVFDDRMKPMVESFVYCLLHELVQYGWVDLARTLWAYFRPRQRYSRKPVESYDFNTVFLSQSGFDGGQTSKIIKEVAVFFDDEDEYEILNEPSLTRLILDQVCESGTLTCASQVGSEVPRALFEACNQQDLVFTPLTVLGDKASAESIYEDQAMSWRVRNTGTRVTQCDVLHCLGRRRGIYRIEDLVASLFVLD